MITESFIGEFAALLEVQRDVLTDDFNMPLEVSWDSLAFIGTISLVDKHFDMVLDVGSLKKINTFYELKLLIESLDSTKCHIASSNT